MSGPGIQTFAFTGKAIRVVMIDGAPFFVAADVCTVLGLKNPSQVVAPLKASQKGVHRMETLRGIQRMAVVNEQGLYAIILRCDKPAARPFFDWITEKVLPAIRKTGRYEFKPEDLSGFDIQITLLNEDHQREHSKAYAAVTGHKDRIIQGRVEMCLAVTGRRPKDIREQGEVLGLKGRDKESAPQVLRAIGDIGAPVYAGINLMVAYGATLEAAIALKPELQENLSALRSTLLKGGVDERAFAKLPKSHVAQLLAEHEARRRDLDHQLLLDLGG